jgi:formyltetrahydrofolate-dependent phosphoribosylglycinamide formyltransferase
MPLPHLRLAVLVSGGGTTLQNLAECIARGELPATIACVIASNHQAYGITRARDLKLACQVIARREYASAEAFSAAITRTVRAHDVHLVCLAGFLSLWQIPADYAAAPESAAALHPALATGLPRVMNIHPALLPKFGGQGMHGHHVHDAVLAAQESASGCTVHFCDNQYDNGPIIIQRRCPVWPADTADTLAARVFEEEKRAYPEAIRMYAGGYLRLADGRAIVPKVLAYITRQNAGRRELLIFDHADFPEAGTQVPAGTMEAREPADVAVLREAAEETGLHGLRLVRKIGVFGHDSPYTGTHHQRHVYHLATDEPTPDAWDHVEHGTLPSGRESSWRFRFRWAALPLTTTLAGEHGAYLDRLSA